MQLLLLLVDLSCQDTTRAAIDKSGVGNFLTIEEFNVLYFQNEFLKWRQCCHGCYITLHYITLLAANDNTSVVLDQDSK